MAYKITPRFYPIVYVRGYAMGASSIEEAYNNAYYGFADTSVEKRDAPAPDYFKADVFESQLIRFMKTKQYLYCDEVNRGKDEFLVDPTRSIWISRFYDQDFYKTKIRSIEDHAKELLQLICEDIPNRLKNELDVDLGPNNADYKVILLAHSMGGLVCRTVIQNLLPAAGEDPKRWIHRFVTMGTPHGGIKMGLLPIGLQNFLTSVFNPDDANMFSEDEMRRYLLLEDKTEFDVHTLGAEEQKSSFPVKRCFCLIGSDYHSYQVGAGIVKHITGEVSDGLVKQDCAYLVAGRRPPANPDGTAAEYPDEQRAFWANVHRAHSGYRGIVNSYESFENLHRFLFGDIKADISLENIQINTPPGNPTDFYDFEFMFSIRKLPLFLHRREQDPCENAMRKTRAAITPNGNLFLHTAFLNSKLGDGDDLSHFSFKIRVVEHRIKDHFWEQDYPERAIYDETAEVAVNLGQTPAIVQYHWLSDLKDAINWQSAALEDGKYSFPLRQAGSFSATMVIRPTRWPDPALTLD